MIFELEIEDSLEEETELQFGFATVLVLVSVDGSAMGDTFFGFVEFE